MPEASLLPVTACCLGCLQPQSLGVEPNVQCTWPSDPIPSACRKRPNESGPGAGPAQSVQAVFFAQSCRHVMHKVPAPAFWGRRPELLPSS